LPTRSGRPPAVDTPSSSAWLTAGGLEANSFQWAAANQPEARRAQAARNATAARASLFRKGPALDARVRYVRAGVIGGAGVDRGGFRCLATVAVRDTISFPSGAAGALNFHPAAGPAGTPRQRRAHPVRVHGDRIAVATARWVLLTHKVALLAPAAAGELRKTQVPLRHVDHARRPISPVRAAHRPAAADRQLAAGFPLACGRAGFGGPAAGP